MLFTSTSSTPALCGSRAPLSGLTRHSRKCLCEVLWKHQRTRRGPHATTPHSGRAGSPHTEAHSGGNTARVKTKEETFILSFAQRAAPAPLTKLRAACTGLSPLSRLQQHVPHPPDWHCHIKAPQNPLQQSRIWLRQHTYPNTRLHTINHYSGARGLL